MNDFFAELRKIPPVTRFLCASSLGVTIPVLMNILPTYRIFYSYGLVFNKLQLWRLHTSFFLGGKGIQYIFDLVMLYRTSDHLENGPYSRRSADYAYQLLFACASIILATTPLSAAFFFHPFLVCLVYLSAYLSPPGTQTSLMGLITIPVKYFPYVIIGLDLLMGGPGYAVQAVAGAVVGHFWWWGVWGGGVGARGGVLSELGRAPRWMRKLVGEPRAPPPGVGEERGGGGVYMTAPRSTLQQQQQQQQPTDGQRGGRGAPTRPVHDWGSGRSLGSS